NYCVFHNGSASVVAGASGTCAGDGNGIKLGKDSGTHVLTNMLVWGNPANGIDVNGNATEPQGVTPTITHGVTIYNNTSYNNGGKNFHFDEEPTTAYPPAQHILRNNLSFHGSGTLLSGIPTEPKPVDCHAPWQTAGALVSLSCSVS